jgi:hypothetical protein
MIAQFGVQSMFRHSATPGQGPAKGFIPAPPECLRMDEPTPVKQPLRDFAEDIRVPQIDRVGSALLDAVS